MRTEYFDKWLSNNLYPFMEASKLYPGKEKKEMSPAVAKRYAELCEQRIT
jgi:hypothetical protein